MSQPLSFEGVFPILPTPFDANEKLDLASLERLVSFMAQLGVDGVTILGVLGESNRLLDAERAEVIRAALQAAGGRIPVVVGTSHPGTRATAGLCRMAEELGAAAVMVTPSKEPVPSEERIFHYYRAIADETSLPMVVQDHPASTQVHMSLDLLLRLAAEIPQVACFKAEALPSPVRVTALRQGMEGGRRVPILTGLGALYGLFDLQAGADGFNTGFAFPEVLMAMVRAVRDGHMERAAALYQRFLPLIVFEQQPGVAIRKEIVRRRGLIKEATVRHPGAQLNPVASAQLDGVLEQVLPDVDITRPLAL